MTRHCRPRLMPCFAFAFAATLAACSHPPAPPPSLRLPSTWDGANAFADETPASARPWWARAGDPAIDALVAAAESGHPSIDAVLARVDEARAEAGGVAAASRPTLGLGAAAQRGRSAGDIGEPAPTGTALSATVTFRWELDIAGRVRASAQAAQQRLAAREADAAHARLLLQHQVVAATLALRACRMAEQLHEDVLASRRSSFDALRVRWKAGLVPLVEVRAELGRLGLAAVELASQQQACSGFVHQLVALTGLEPEQVRVRVAPTLAGSAWPEVVLPRPATVLLAHPSVHAAVREMNAAWSDIGAARAARWPRLSLEAGLSRTWLRAGGASQAFTPWSIAPALLAPLLDGGAGAAGVSAARARYRGAVARVESTLRQARAEVEDALAAVESAQRRSEASATALAAASEVWRVAELRREVGAIAPLELEEARRQFIAARLAALQATRDRGLAWAALVGASGDAAWVDGATA